MLILHAANVHQGGGRSLLLSLLRQLSTQSVAHLDARLQPMPLPTSDNRVTLVPATLLGRLSIEWHLSSIAGPDDCVICFGNLPPLFSCRARVVLFIQSRYMVCSDGIADLPWRSRLRVLIERQWLKYRLRGSEVVVQTQSMAALTKEALGVEATVCAFSAEALEAKEVDEPGDEPHIDYLYVASGEPHKNHQSLVEAWELLAAKGHTPTLGLTVAPVSGGPLALAIARAQSLGARIVLLESRSPDKMPALYASAGALIYPSLFESFGLPLIEAQEQGTPILASERDYVRDLVTPTETFDPTSSHSIARAVLRYDKRPEPTASVLDAAGFLSRCMQRK